MKKLFLAVALFACVGLLSGCKSDTGGFDDANSATFEETDSVPTDDSGEPPIPPEPTEAQ